MNADRADRDDTVALPDEPDYLAPDGSEVRLLCQGRHGGMAHFRLASAGVSRAVEHRTVDELWYVVSGSGELWRDRQSRGVNPTVLRAGVSVLITAGTAFQFRALGDAPLDIVAVTVPPWPGEHEAEFAAPYWSES